MKKLTNREKVMTGVIIVLLLLFVGASYAWLSLTLFGQKTHVLHVAGLEITLDESMSEGIDIQKAFPITDEEGKEGIGYTFTIKNEGMLDSDYQIYLDDLPLEEGKVRLEDQYVKFQLLKNDEEVELVLLSVVGENPNRLLDQGTIRRNVTDRYTLRLWVDYDAPVSIAGQIFKAKLRVEAVQTREHQDESGAATPVLAPNMIPVVYDEASSVWKKADKAEEWFNYGKQMWANAVTVTDATRRTYKTADPGTEVKMDDILQMYVWIPRYSYTIKSEDGTNYYGKKEEGRTDAPTQALPGEIDVHFISTARKDTGSAQYTGSDTPSEWYTPPGFTFGEKELSGLWVGKFETGYMGATSSSAAEKDIVEPNKVIIKPNVYSWRGIGVSTLDLVSRGVVSSGNIYGFDSTYDSHAAKNTEWALVTYLSQSKYGKYGNSLYTKANKEIYINNNSKILTGCSGGTPSATGSSTCNQYNVIANRGSGKGALGAGASTTGTIYGIYDMSGGAWEYVMGNYNGALGSSGYTSTSLPDAKYYDLYTTSDANTACNGSVCKGHALNEVAGWYSDSSFMVESSYPWSVRGGYYNDNTRTGVFYFDDENGAMSIGRSFRLVLTP